MPFTFGNTVAVLGIGCRATCTKSALQHLCIDVLNKAISLHQETILCALSCWAVRAHHSAVLALSKHFNVPLLTFECDALSVQHHRLTHHSSTLFRLTGLCGVAEAAALCATDDYNGHSEIIVPRTVSSEGSATAALAICRMSDGDAFHLYDRRYHEASFPGSAAGHFTTASLIDKEC